MEIIEKEKRMSIEEIPSGSVIKVDNAYWIVTDKLVDDAIMIINLADGDWLFMTANEVAEVVEKVKLVIG